jgi:hypothetical protein
VHRSVSLESDPVWLCATKTSADFLLLSVNMYASTWICTKVTGVPKPSRRGSDATITDGPAAHLEDLQI